MRCVKKIIVTGGCGFIGSAFLRKVVNGPYEILNIDSMTYAADDFWVKAESEFVNYAFRNLSICDGPSMHQIFDGFEPDVVVHFAAETHVDNSIVTPWKFFDTNVKGTFNLLEAVRKLNDSGDRNCLFFHVSTDEVYGSLDIDAPAFEETFAHKPRSPYSASKSASDLMVQAWANTYNVETIVTNCSNNYGPFQHSEKLIPTIIRNGILKHPVPIYGDGSNIRDWLFVDDHVDALIELMHVGPSGEAFNIGGDNEISNLELAERILDLLDHHLDDGYGRGSLIKFVEDRPGHDWRYAVNCKKIKQTTNWMPKTDFGQGLDQTVSWYIEKIEGGR